MMDDATRHRLRRVASEVESAAISLMQAIEDSPMNKAERARSNTIVSRLLRAVDGCRYMADE